MPTEQQIIEKKCHWIGHTLCKPQGATERLALDWNPQGTRMRGRQRKPDYVSTQNLCRNSFFFQYLLHVTGFRS